jgi:hypothetical protein
MGHSAEVTRDERGNRNPTCLTRMTRRLRERQWAKQAAAT